MIGDDTGRLAHERETARGNREKEKGVGRRGRHTIIPGGEN